MRFSVKFEDLGLKKRVKNLSKNGQAKLDTQVLKDSNRYIPAKDFHLRNSGIRMTNPGSGLVIWETPYARKLYYNPEFNFSKSPNPEARGLWFEYAKSKHLKEWVAMLKEEF